MTDQPGSGTPEQKPATPATSPPPPQASAPQGAPQPAASAPPPPPKPPEKRNPTAWTKWSGLALLLLGALLVVGGPIAGIVGTMASKVNVEPSKRVPTQILTTGSGTIDISEPGRWTVRAAFDNDITTCAVTDVAGQDAQVDIVDGNAFFVADAPGTYQVECAPAQSVIALAAKDLHVFLNGWGTPIHPFLIGLIVAAIGAVLALWGWLRRRRATRFLDSRRR